MLMSIFDAIEINPNQGYNYEQLQVVAICPRFVDSVTNFYTYRKQR